MKLSEIEWNPVGLTVADEAESDRGESQVPPDIFRIGTPVVMGAPAYLERTGAPDAALALLKHASDFHYVRLPVSIRPRDPWTLRHLAVEIQLQSSIGEAVAWSMAPEKVVSEVKTKVNASLGSNSEARAARGLGEERGQRRICDIPAQYHRLQSRGFRSGVGILADPRERAFRHPASAPGRSPASPGQIPRLGRPSRRAG